MVADTCTVSPDHFSALKKKQIKSRTVAQGDLLDVIGGAGKGGIIVRTGKDKASPEAASRLATGAVVRATDCEGERLAYELISGEGPASGWVSLSMSGRALLTNRSLQENDAEAALKWYSHRFEAARGVQDNCMYSKNAFPIQSQTATNGVSQQLQVELEMEAAASAQKQRSRRARAGDRKSELDREQDSDGEMVRLCQQCHLPLGGHAYAKDGKIAQLMHGECMAQVMLKDMRKETEEQKHREAVIKKARRKEYDIGWKASMIPSTASDAAKLGFSATPHGMCCLVLDVNDLSVRLAPTFEPASSLNLEYLSLALQVRRLEGREPQFSLDPVDAARAIKESDPEASMQTKTFAPEWLAGTSVGEVMFQADYYLKELSMGEYEQPILGMKSCFDLSEQEGHEQDWNAREWFVIRQAAIAMSDDNVLIPVLKMGVEAREQLLGPNGLEDAPLTRPDHPLVRYAEAFTQNFDLIAERKSVVSQLREVAKASVMAKFMLESGLSLPEAWFSLGEPSLSVCLEVPQLWNDRSSSTIKVKDGTIDRKAKTGSVHSVYGGVDFGVDRFRLGAPSRIATSVVAGRVALGRPSATLMTSSQVNMSMIPTRQFTRLAAPMTARPQLSAQVASQLAAPITARAALSAPLSMSAPRAASSLMATSRMSYPVSGRYTPMSGMSTQRPASALVASRLSMAAPQVTTTRVTMGVPRGVDLSLDSFNLSVAEQEGYWEGTLEAPAGASSAALDGKAFLSSLSKENSIFSSDDHGLLREVFHSKLCDRRGEEECFLLPPTNNVESLRALVQAESSVQEQRRRLFFSADFTPKELGPLFPASWAASVELASASGEEAAKEAAAAASLLQPRPDLQAQEGQLRKLLVDAVPTFDKTTEDGMHFLIYRVGAIELRATQASRGEEPAVGAVFSVRPKAPVAPARGASLRDEDKIVKVTEYVEAAPHSRLHCTYFVVLQAEQGVRVLLERSLATGVATWIENPLHLDERLVGARVVDAADTRGTGVTVGTMRLHHAKEAKDPARPWSGSSAKLYAHSTCSRAAGKAFVPVRPPLVQHSN